MSIVYDFADIASGMKNPNQTFPSSVSSPSLINDQVRRQLCFPVGFIAVFTSSTLMTHHGAVTSFEKEMMWDGTKWLDRGPDWDAVVAKLTAGSDT